MPTLFVLNLLLYSLGNICPETKVSALVEEYAASIVLFDALQEIGLVKGAELRRIRSIKMDSAVALQQLDTQPLCLGPLTKFVILHAIVAAIVLAAVISSLDGQNRAI